MTEIEEREVTYEVYLRYPDDQGVWHLKVPGIETQQEAEEYIDAMKGKRPRYTDSQWRIVRVSREVVTPEPGEPGVA